MKQLTLFFIFCLLVSGVPVMADVTGKGEAAGMDYKTMAAGDARIAYQIMDESKSDNTVMLIMGYGCTMDMWPENMIDALKKHARLILFDNRGMGYSTGGTRAFSIEQFAEDTNILLDSLDVNSVCLVGWSMGTAIALQTALDKPDRVENITLISGFCGGAQTVWPPDEVWARVLDLSGTIEVRVDRMMHNLFPQDFIDAHPGFAGIFPEIVEPVNDEMIARQGKALKQWNGCYARLAEIKVPVLLITGDKDIVIPMENSRIVSATLENSEVEIIKGGGHGVLYQHPDRISKKILSLIK